MRPLNRTTMAAKHAGKWLALKHNRKTVIATGNSVPQVLEAARRKGVDQPIITRLPKHPAHFVGSHDIHRA